MFNSTKDKTMGDKLSAFVDQIKQSDEYVKYATAKEAFDKDTEANKLLKDFQEMQQTYSVFRQGGFDGADDQQKQLQSMQEKIGKSKTIKEILSTQQQFQLYISDLVNSVSRELNFPFAPVQRSGCCG